MEAPTAAAEQRDWVALPAGVLQYTFCLASTCHTPGTCLAAPVCRAWRSAAAGCSGIRLLYHAGYGPADQSFVSWLKSNSKQLGALILGSSDSSFNQPILAALAEAAAAAQAAGRPLRLQTLRVMQEYVTVGNDCFGYQEMQGYVYAHTAGQLVASLPHLRCLQLGITWPHGESSSASGVGADMNLESLAPLQHATQLEELYLVGPGPPNTRAGPGMAVLLPASLKRLSWQPWRGLMTLDLSHLTQATFLQLGGRPWARLSSSKLPPGVRQLEVTAMDWRHLEVLEGQQQVVTALAIEELNKEEVQQLLSRLPNLTAATVDSPDMWWPAPRAAVKQLTQLSALTVTSVIPPYIGPWHSVETSQGMQQTVGLAASMSSLRRLHLEDDDRLVPTALTVLTALTQLRVTTDRQGMGYAPQQQAWAAAVPHMAGLRWLSLPSELLGADLAWLGGLQQLRVLVVRSGGKLEGAPPVSSMPWLEGCTRQVPPPSLQVLAVSGMTAAEAAAWQLRRRLQQWVGSSGCQVVVGVNLDEVAEPTQQLAGLPVALQQVLA